MSKVNSSPVDAALNPFKPLSFAEKLLYTVKRVEAQMVGGMWSVGTGYVCSVPVGHDKSGVSPVLVTNKHVVDGAQHVRICFHTAIADADEHRPDGKHVFIDLLGSQTGIIKHPNEDIDLCALLLAPLLNAWGAANSGRSLYFNPLGRENIISHQYLAQLDITQEVVMVGCPSGLWDEVNGFPLFRRGTLASGPAIDWMNRPEMVVDIGVYSGSSGSPIFLLETGFFRPDKSTFDLEAGARFALLGTLWGGPRITEKGEIRVEPVPTSTTLVAETGIRMHLGYVIKGPEVLRLLDTVQEALSGETVSVQTLARVPLIRPWWSPLGG